jgi:hypothetical protein
LDWIGVLIPLLFVYVGVWVGVDRLGGCFLFGFTVHYIDIGSGSIGHFGVLCLNEHMLLRYFFKIKAP